MIGRRDGQPAGEVQAAAAVAVGAGGEQVAVERPERHPPAAGDDGVQALDHRLGADVGGDLGAAPRVAAVGGLAHGAKADRAGRERAPEQLDRLLVGAGGRGRPRLWCGWAWWCLLRESMGWGQAASGRAWVARPASARKRDGPPVGRPARTCARVITSVSLARVAAT